jgi:hypothetical protein
LDEGLSLFAQVVGLKVFDPVETDFVVKQAYMGGDEVGWVMEARKKARATTTDLRMAWRARVDGSPKRSSVLEAREYLPRKNLWRRFVSGPMGAPK